MASCRSSSTRCLCFILASAAAEGRLKSIWRPCRCLICDIDCLALLDGLRWKGIADSGTSLPSRLILFRSAVSVVDRLRAGVTRSMVLPVLSVATLASERRDFFTSGSFNVSKVRDVIGAFIALRLDGAVWTGPPNFLFAVRACSGRRFM